MRCANACVGESVPLSLSSATVSAFYTSVTLYTTFNVAAVNGRRLPRSLYLSLAIMSTLSTADKESSYDDSKDRPITLDGDPVIWDRNPATLRGALKEVELYYTREGLFQELFSDRTAAESGASTTSRPISRGRSRKAR